MNMNRSLLSVLCVLLMLAGLPSALAQESGWPRTLPLEQGTVTIYSPQVDEMSDGVMHFRSALAYRATAGSEPVFGAAWFESRVEIDRSRRIVHPTDLKVTQTRFPAGTDDVQSELSAVLAQQSPAWNLDFSLDQLEAALKTAEAESRAQESLNTEPPRIVYRDHPALLISLDGEPVLREIENSPLEAVINTPYPLIYDGKHYYLNAAKGVWYRAGKATGPYQFEASPPAVIAAMVNGDEQEAAAELPAEPISAANAPEIVVSTEPAELIVTEGPAAFVPLVDDLLVLQNSDDDVFMHVSAQEFYIVLAGRWYRASSLNGPWAYQPADDLPAAFANIPRDSNQADARVYVAGTEEARDAVLDAQVPQTAAVARGEVDIEVEYDGDPVYRPVDGTDLVYIENTGSTVLQSNGLYYLVEDGVWYVSYTPEGPWQVSDHRPAQVDTILPTSPLYNVKYVRVYDSTPDVVYVGYTPGYLGSYVYHDTLFYGSGWYYSPWVSPHYYYPRHSTWGFNVGYNPWSGWNFGLSWGWGPFSVGFYTGGYWHQNHYWHDRHYGRWGPGGYRPRHHGGRGYGRNRYAYNDYGRRGSGRGGDGRGGDRRGGDGRNAYGDDRSNPRQRNDNLYRDGAQRARVADTVDVQPRNKAGRSKTSPVSPSVLRSKADVRDANFAARRSAKGTKSRTTPLPPDSRQKVKQTGGRSRTESGVRRTTQSPAVASSRQLRSQAAENRARQRSSPEVNTPVRQSQPRLSSNSARQRSSPAVNTPVRQSQPRISSNSVRQRSSQVVSTPRPGQNNSRPGPQPQSSRNSGHGNSALAQRAPQRSAQKSGSRRNGSNGGGGGDKRAAASRPRRR
jgi:hypothetical protein